MAIALSEGLEARRLGMAFTELRCTFGNYSVVPDVSVFRWDRLDLDEDGEISDGLTGAPDWAIEILSPRQLFMTMTEKMVGFLDNGLSLG